MKAFAAAFVVVLTLTASARAAADLTGRVVFSGLPVPGVTITATMGSKKAATVTDEDGEFRFGNLNDGTWTLRTEMRGFASDVRDVAVPPPASPLVVALKMQSYAAIGATAAAEVPATTPAPAQAGAVEPPPDTPDILNGSVVNGAASIFAQPRAFGNNRPSGGSRYNGAFTAVLGNSAWNAAPYSFGPSRLPAPSYDDLQLGFTLAGPFKIPGLVRNGPLTHVSYQHAVAHRATSQSALMPTAAERAGDFSQTATIIRDPRTGEPFPGNIIPPDRVSPQAAALVAYYPLPTGATSGGANFDAPILTASTSDLFQAGANKPLNRNRTQLGMLVNYQRTVADTDSVFGFTDRSRLSSLNATVTLGHRFSQQVSMRATYRFARSVTDVTPFFAGRVNVSGDAGITGNNQDPENWGPPALAFPAIADLRDADHQQNAAVTHTAGAEATWRRGRHAITFGGDVRRNAVDVSSQPDPRGTLAFTGRATGDALADFLLGLPATSAIAFGTSVAELRQPTYDAYVSDDFRAGAGLTLTLGLRWEYEAPFRERSGQLVNLAVEPDFTSVTPVIGESLLRPDKRGVEPRLAMSWRPVAGSSLVIRGSYGLYRTLGVYEPLARLLAQQPPFSKSFSVQNSLEAPLTLANPFPESIPAESTFAVDPDFRAAFAHTWQAVVQRDLPGSLTVIASYDGSRGTHLMQAFLPNTYPAGAVNPCPSCPAGFVYVTSGGESLRNAMQLILRRRLHNGLTASVQYTLSKSTDDAATFTGRTIAPGSLGIAQNWLDLDAEHGPSSFDQRHQVAVQFQYTTGVGISGGTLVDGVRGALFKDWTVASQLSTGSGLPVTPVSFITVTGTGTVGVRPDLTGESTAPTSAGSYVNAAAFTAPASGTWGDAGRNSIRGPAQFSLDASVSRVFRLGGRVSLEWRVAGTNILNRVTYSAINTTVTSPQFGFPTRANPMRQLNTTFRLRF